ncbi:unnamed protein product [Chrysoparadoxa australica]
MATAVPQYSIGSLTFTPPPNAGVNVVTSNPATWSGDLIVVPVFQPASEDKEALAELTGRAAAVDASLNGAISELIKAESFKGAAKSSASMLTLVDGRMQRVAVAGLGKETDVKADSHTGMGATLAALAKSTKAVSMAYVSLPSDEEGAAVSKVAEGLLSGLYADTRYKGSANGDNNKPPKLETVDILCQGEVGADVVAAASIERGVSLCRDLVNSPANFATPQSLADTARAIAEECEGMEVEILQEDEIKARGMGAYMGVAQGAVLPPQFIHLTYKPKGAVNKKLALVGKGLTFDSGGYNLKAGAGSMIEMMKFDMGGSAAVLGTAKAIGLLGPDGVEAHFIVAACENMVSDKAMRPGDILTASNGKTIEVLNTDAEGRLTLADALVFAEGLGVDGIIDTATLTGAIIVALGPEYAGLWASDDALADQILHSAGKTGEKIWRMPLAAEYSEMIKSKIADLKNIGGKGAGSITAALFLKEFVKKTPWAHIDIAGTVWNGEKGGATGYGVRMFSHWLISQGKK